MVLYVGLLILAAVVLGASGFGRRTYVIGSSAAVARYSGVGVARHKLVIMTISSVTAALAGILLAAHLGAVRSSTAFGWELDIITIVLLGGVSIFGGSGTMLGVFLSTLLVLNIRNGLGLAERARSHAERRRGAAAHPVGPAAEPHGELPGPGTASGPGEAGDAHDDGRPRGRRGVAELPLTSLPDRSHRSGSATVSFAERVLRIERVCLTGCCTGRHGGPSRAPAAEMAGRSSPLQAPIVPPDGTGSHRKGDGGRGRA